MIQHRLQHGFLWFYAFRSDRCTGDISQTQPKEHRRNDFTLSYPKALAVFSLSRDLQRDRPKHNFGHQFESKLLIRYSAH